MYPLYLGGYINSKINDLLLSKNDYDDWTSVIRLSAGGDIQPLLRETTFGYPRCWSRKWYHSNWCPSWYPWHSRFIPLTEYYTLRYKHPMRKRTKNRLFLPICFQIGDWNRAQKAHAFFEKILDTRECLVSLQ